MDIDPTIVARFDNSTHHHGYINLSCGDACCIVVRRSTIEKVPNNNMHLKVDVALGPSPKER